MEKNPLINIESYKLDNGLTCYIHSEAKQTDSTIVCLSVKAGSAYEKKGENGWFHFLEHLSIYSYFYTPRTNVQKTEYFKAFNYAYTSFYETAYFFKAVDATGELLQDSLITAKGILNGMFLTEASLLQTRDDVLNEYHAFWAKAWYSACAKALKRHKITMPVGLQEDIQSADYEKLLQMHREYYHPGNAAIIITAPHNTETIYAMIAEIFHQKTLPKSDFIKVKTEYDIPEAFQRKAEMTEAIQPYILLAWHPRHIMPVLETLKNYISLAVLARSIEISLIEKEWFDAVECEVEIFNRNYYTFRLKVFKKETALSRNTFDKIIRDVSFSPELFEKAKTKVLHQLKEQYQTGFAKMQAGDIVNCCREHFLYEEPIISVEDEFESSYRFLKNLKYSMIREGFETIIKQFALYYK